MQRSSTISVHDCCNSDSEIPDRVPVAAIRSELRVAVGAPVPSATPPTVRERMFGALPVDAVSGAAAWLDELNPEQLAAATHADGPLLILAGAGTGKTTTLCARVAWLVTEGVSPERIMLLTFTRRASREMLGRTRAMVPMPSGSGGVVGGTFHSVAHRFVRMHASSLGLAPGFAVLDPGDAADLIDLIREEHGHAQSRRRFPRKSTLLDIYSRTVNFQRTLSDVVAESFPWCEEHVEAMAMLFKAYTARKRSLGVLDLDDLLLYWRALASDDVVGRAIGRSIDHLLIDEYQDVNGLQVDLVRGLRRERGDVTAVGDDMQAIYGWRSASAEHILEFPRHFPNATVITLERNYRSSQPILDTANEVAAQAERSYPKRLRAETALGSRPQLIVCRDEGAQGTEVCERVLAARERGMDLRRQAVLMRTSHDSDLLELALTRRQIPFVKYGGLRYLEAAHVKDLMALFRLVDNRANELAWFRVLQLLDGVGPVTARRVLDVLVTQPGRAIARPANGAADPEPRAGELTTDPEPLTDEPTTDREPWTGTLTTDPEPSMGELTAIATEGWREARELLPVAARPGADALAAALDAARAPGMSAGPQAERLREALAPLVRAKYPDGAVRLQDLDQLVAAARQSADIGHFASELALDPPQSSADLAGPPHLDEDYLVLSTIHSAKGLEWDGVHVLALYDGNFPACMSAGTSESIDEERRLLYVAMTRARRELHLYVPVRYYHRPKGIDDAHGYGKPSRFLTGEVQQTCETVRLADDGSTGLEAARSPPRKISVSVDSLFC
jgi:DNA helicase-2/ATP-dependent DNA helicase PcrA